MFSYKRGTLWLSLGLNPPTADQQNANFQKKCQNDIEPVSVRFNYIHLCNSYSIESGFFFCRFITLFLSWWHVVLTSGYLIVKRRWTSCQLILWFPLGERLFLASIMMASFRFSGGGGGGGGLAGGCSRSGGCSSSSLSLILIICCCCGAAGGMASGWMAGGWMAAGWSGRSHQWLLTFASVRYPACLYPTRSFRSRNIAVSLLVSSLATSLLLYMVVLMILNTFG